MIRMEIENIKIEAIKPYENNPRHNDDAVSAVAESIRQFGFKVPLVIDKDNVIVCGHTRYKASKRLGLKELPCVRADDLTDDQIKAYRLADNKVAELADWDLDKLQIELDDIEMDMSEFGFEDLEIEDMDSLVGGVELDDVPELPTEPKAKRGDIYLLGNHRLMCGDSTDADDLKLLMMDEDNPIKADMVFTDPPYALFGNSTGVHGVTDDKMTRPFFLAIFQRIKENTKKYAHIYACCDWHSAFSLQAMAKKAELTEKNLIIWDKGDGGLGAMYQQCYEMIWFYANSPIAKQTLGKKESGERTINGKPNIWRYKRENSNNRVHNAQKPVEMVQYAIENSSDKGDYVLDLFGGSGTTLIASEITHRKCLMMELDEKYVDVIIERWEKLTGKKAILLK